ncbi:hypothetical protein ACFLX7_05245 [Chloroflexota bacterium]
MATKRIHCITILLGIVLVLSACATPPSQQPEYADEDSYHYSPCSLSTEMVGQSVKAVGEIAFVDNTDPDGVYADLEEDSCRVGIWVSMEQLQEWTESMEGNFVIGAKIAVAGLLTEVPMPARPEDKQLVIELSSLPRLLGTPAYIGPESSEIALPPLDKPAYRFNEDDLWQDIRVAGIITFVDDSKAAGLYAEMDREDHVLRLWVERTRWNTWDEDGQADFSAGKSVVVDGILTLVLNEPVVDLSVPPHPN